MARHPLLALFAFTFLALTDPAAALADTRPPSAVHAVGATPVTPAQINDWEEMPTRGRTHGLKTRIDTRSPLRLSAPRLDAASSWWTALWGSR